MSFKNNIWEAAIAQAKIKNEESNNQSERTLIIAGNKKSGKTTLTFRFVEKQEAPKPTLALEYLYARQSKNSGSGKDICHIWEFGGGTLFTELLQIPIKAEILTSLGIIFALDLSKPEELYFTFETLLKQSFEQIEKSLKFENDSDVTLEKLKETAAKRFGVHHPDKDFVDVFPVPLVIVGTKYDLFENFEPEIRKVICRTLRFLAHAHGAMLQFTSSKSESLIGKMRMTLSHLSFGANLTKSCIVDYTKPIIIPFGTDSLELIGGVNSNNDYVNKTLPRCLDMWKDSFVSVFPQKNYNESVIEDPGIDPNFEEKDIDFMKVQKDKELDERIQVHKRNIHNDEYFEM